MPTDENERMLSVAEVLEMVPGDDRNATWVNPGLIAVVREIKRTEVKKTGKPMFICTLADTVGSATISMTVFAAPKFTEGDQIEIRGQGLRRTEFRGLQQISPSQKTEFHLLGRSVHHEEQVKRAAAGEPSVNGQPQHVLGVTVGMAIKEALALATKNLSNEESLSISYRPEFWSQIHTVASDIIRVARLLELGKLAPPIRERVKSSQSASRTLSPPVPDQRPLLPEEEDVPF